MPATAAGVIGAATIIGIISILYARARAAPGTPQASFGYVEEGEYAPVTVDFTDSSTSVPPIESWVWDFGDGATALGQAVTHIYERGGEYTVTLTVTNMYGSSSASQVLAIPFSPGPPIASFRMDYDAEVPAPRPVDFTDLSVSETPILSWHWDFGDGHRSNERNPSHTFEAGTWEITLTVSNEWGSDISSPVSLVVESAEIGPKGRITKSDFEDQGESVKVTVDFVNDGDEMAYFDVGLNLGHDGGNFVTEKGLITGAGTVQPGQSGQGIDWVPTLALPPGAYDALIELGDYRSTEQQWARLDDWHVYSSIYTKPGNGNGNGGDYNYYVDARNGSDSYNGVTPDRAFRTIEKALSVAITGDRIQVRTGGYSGFTITKSAITIEGLGIALVMINGQIRINGAGNAVRHLTARNSSNDGIQVYGDDTIIQYIEEYDSGGSGIRNISSYRNQYLDLTCHHNMGGAVAPQHCDGISFSNWNGPGGNNLIKRGVFYSNADDGVDAWMSRDNMIEESIVFDSGYSGDGNGFKLGEEGSNTTRRSIAFRNKAEGFNNNGGSGNRYDSNTGFENNYDFANWSYEHNNRYRNNLAYRGKVAVGGDADQAYNSWNLGISNPRFLSADTSSPDFLALAADSPCRGAASDGSDLGALQYGQRIADLIGRPWPV
jgi:PKD repeat protein